MTVPPSKLPILIVLIALAGTAFAAPVTREHLDGASPAAVRRALVAAAETWLGTPYRYGGADRRGMDCSGLIYASFLAAAGLSPPRTAEALYNWAEPINPARLAAGDLVFFITGGAGVSHAGIYAGDGRFIHAASDGPQTGVIYSRLDEAYWRRTFAGAGRVLPPAPGAEEHDGEANPGQTARTKRAFFTAFGLAVTWGGFLPDSPSPLRGAAAQVRAGYQGLFHKDNLTALELRPEWDGALGVVRLGAALSLGNERLRVFAGPVITLGDPVLTVDGETCPYRSPRWLGAAGVSASLPPVKAGRGALSLFGEACWQFYTPEGDQTRNPKNDMAANLRLSLGLSFTLFWPAGRGDAH
ncbi:MAG: C40 family peptidase [Spirochaetaceae bacterium]|jgi:probable lipoprotein NlpC|nr:C40 family peptidase [Spirochaetaceae bacterium]